MQDIEYNFRRISLCWNSSEKKGQIVYERNVCVSFLPKSAQQQQREIKFPWFATFVVNFATTKMVSGENQSSKILAARKDEIWLLGRKLEVTKK